MDASHAVSGCAPPTTQCLQAEENVDYQHMPVPNNNDTANGDVLSSPPSIIPDSVSRRPHRISAASTLSDQGSDIFSSCDSRRSTVSSVSFSEAGSASSPSSSPQTPLTRSRENAKLLQAARIQRRRAESVNTNGTANTADDDDENNNNHHHNNYRDISPGLLRRRKRGASTKKYQPANPKAALAATEPPHENLLTKMAFAEQQRWITVQQKTFTKWLNTKIEARGLEVVDLVKDLSDGVSTLPTTLYFPPRVIVGGLWLTYSTTTTLQVMLIHLLECLSQESLGRYAAKPKLRVQRFENVNLGLDFVKNRGIQMTNIGAEDVVDGNRKIILGLIWTLILRFTISDINEAGMSAKEGLLLWCQRKTACYDECDVRDFSTSWNDGLAFCALLDIHRPDLIDYDELDKSDHRGNMQLAFDLAHKEIGIPKLLDVEDVCDVAKPDERSLMTYIAYWFHAFSQMEKVENAGRRVEKFVNNMQGAWEMQSAYERRMAALLKAIREQIEEWQTAKFEGTYADAKAQATQFSGYKRGKKREWVAEKSELATLLGNIKTKLGTYRLRPYEPPAELRLDVLDKAWADLSSSEMARGQLINETIRE